MHRFKLLILILLAALFLAWHQAPSVGQVNHSSTQLKAPQVTGPTLQVTFFDIGQGDAALIQTPDGQNILVDGGPDDTILDKLGQTLSFGKRRIDTMILTHPHADHLVGLISVLERYEVGEIYYTGVVHTTNEFFEWLRLIKEKNIPLKIIKEPQTLTYGQVKLEMLYPDSDLSNLQIMHDDPVSRKLDNNLNNTSIVFRLVYGQSRFLFTGDAQDPVERILLKKGADLRAQVLKVGHHGSHSSTSDAFLDAILPQYAVISVGAGNDYGHPHRRTLRRLERHGIKILRTDQDGDIEFTSDGQHLYNTK